MCGTRGGQTERAVHHVIEPMIFGFKVAMRRTGAAQAAPPECSCLSLLAVVSSSTAIMPLFSGCVVVVGVLGYKDWYTGQLKVGDQQTHNRKIADISSSIKAVRWSIERVN